MSRRAYSTSETSRNVVKDVVKDLVSREKILKDFHWNDFRFALAALPRLGRSKQCSSEQLTSTPIMDTDKKIDELNDEVAELINAAITADNDKTKVQLLQEVQELVIHHDLLDNFLEEVVFFQSDKSVEVRKFVISFMEKSCSKDPECFPKLILNFKLFLEDDNVNVVKKCVQSLALLYKAFLTWISKAKTIDEQIEPTWVVWKQIKESVFFSSAEKKSLFESTANAGLKTLCLKFMEVVVICQSKSDRWTVSNDDINVSQLEHINLWTVDELTDEADSIFKLIIEILEGPDISSVNLMVCIQSLVTIAKQRSLTYMSEVVKALESYNSKLPSASGKVNSQVSSVKKQLKLQLLSLLKHPFAFITPKHQTDIRGLLSKLGSSDNEIVKCMQEIRKRGLKAELVPLPTKRIKLEADVKSESPTPEAGLKVNRADAYAALESTVADIASRLELKSKAEPNVNVVDLSLVSLLNLPDRMPSNFPSQYNTDAKSIAMQIAQTSRVLASQITAAGLGTGVDQIITKNSIEIHHLSAEKKSKIRSYIGASIVHEAKKYEHQEKEKEKSHLALKLAPTGKVKSASIKLKHTNWPSITKPLSITTRDHFIQSALNRILLKEEVMSKFSQDQIQTRLKILAHLSNVLDDQSDDENTQIILDHALSDLRVRQDIIIKLVNDWYTCGKEKGDFTRYARNFGNLIRQLILRGENKDKDQFLQKFLTEAPQIPDEVIDCLKEYILELNTTESIDHLITLLTTLARERSSVRSACIVTLMQFCICKKQEVRQLAIRSLQQLHSGSIAELKEMIEDHCLTQLSSLKDIQEFDEESIKLQLIPFLSILPQAHNLVHQLANVYVLTPDEVKRVIFRCLESPVKSMGMNSPELLRLVETCPKGAETLVTRMIHVLTDKQAPSAELVARVKDLYYNRVPDVRCLIPVLNGLSKKEIITALPQLIRLNQLVVKEVFNRLLGIHHVDSAGACPSSLSPSELLVALHGIDTSKCDVKTVIKATNLCFQEKNIYTQEVLAVTIQLLVDQTPLPTLLMRTVIQSLSSYPNLLGFVMNTLQRLIPKQVWKQKKVWEGFVKCCQQTKPRSFQVLLQLPVPQLLSVFTAWPDLREELKDHISSLNDAQRSRITKSVLDAVFESNNDPQ